jgi:hypothetical protein
MSHIDSEYSRAGIMDPKIILTTSRDPSSKLLQFAKASDKQHASCAAFVHIRCAGDAPGFPEFLQD